MAHYQVILAYDGTEFRGFQRQQKTRTVQGEVEAALRRLNWSGESILCAGRTDTGAHASGQVISFELDWRQGSEKLRGALNEALPADIAARKVTEVDAGFHPRFMATAREYCYRICLDPVRNPLTERYTWRVYHPLDTEILQRTAELFKGCHDFQAYGTPPRPSSSTVREVTRSHWVIEGNLLRYQVRANAFLYHMVRRLVFVQVKAAAGKIDLQELQQHLEEGIPHHPGIAPACGLELVEVVYGEKRSGDACL